VNVGVMCHPTDDTELEGIQNEVSTGVVNRHEDRGGVDDEMSRPDSAPPFYP
jgi:hypothetical protein